MRQPLSALRSLGWRAQRKRRAREARVAFNLWRSDVRVLVGFRSRTPPPAKPAGYSVSWEAEGFVDDSETVLVDIKGAEVARVLQVSMEMLAKEDVVGQERLTSGAEVGGTNDFGRLEIKQHGALEGVESHISEGTVVASLTAPPAVVLSDRRVSFAPPPALIPEVHLRSVDGVLVAGRVVPPFAASPSMSLHHSGVNLSAVNLCIPRRRRHSAPSRMDPLEISTAVADTALPTAASVIGAYAASSSTVVVHVAAIESLSSGESDASDFSFSTHSSDSDSDISGRGELGPSVVAGASTGFQRGVINHDKYPPWPPSLKDT